MVDSAFPMAPLQGDFLPVVLSFLQDHRELWAPRIGTDGAYRLLPHAGGPWPDLAVTTFLPLKKLLLPPFEELWSYQAGHFSDSPIPQEFAVIGMPLCDLQAVWYLDRVFAADEAYQARRNKSFLVGMPCEPNEHCHCDGNLMPLAGDLFLDRERLWALSPAGEKLAKRCGCHFTGNLPLPWPSDITDKRHAVTEKVFRSTAEHTIWADEAQRCLSCGACSAVCPTCYCFDMLDVAAVDGSVTRNRAWDNCFFAEHGKVAGGQDFRPGRKNRLRFRMEHKHLGFGLLLGQNSCVGCGRCRRACPVDIDLDRIAERLGSEAAP
jgi:sulfhydrogenase subunit beta (sulfur reductase)